MSGGITGLQIFSEIPRLSTKIGMVLYLGNIYISKECTQKDQSFELYIKFIL